MPCKWLGAAQHTDVAPVLLSALHWPPRAGSAGPPQAAGGAPPGAVPVPGVCHVLDRCAELHFQLNAACSLWGRLLSVVATSGLWDCRVLSVVAEGCLKLPRQGRPGCPTAGSCLCIKHTSAGQARSACALPMQYAARNLPRNLPMMCHPPRLLLWNRSSHQASSSTTAHAPCPPPAACGWPTTPA